jgi:hypothetical protein
MQSELRRVAAAAAAAAAANTQSYTDPTQSQQEGASTSSRPGSPAADTNVGFWPLMRRKEVWAIAVAQYASSFGFYGLLAWLPSFFLEHCGLQLSKVRVGS